MLFSLGSNIVHLCHFRMGEGKKRILRKSALVFDDPLQAYECARKVCVHVLLL